MGCTLIDELEITQPTLSYHLDILTKAGLTTVYKEGTWKKAPYQSGQLPTNKITLKHLKKVIRYV